MGKEGSSSWLTAVKRAFRSPTKGTPVRKDHIKREEHGEQEDNRQDQKKTVKRRWIFRKLASHTQSFEVNVSNNRSKRKNSIATDKQRSTTAVSEEVQAAEESVGEIRPANLVRRNYAALLIQTAFRGYLARQALCALKGIVKLQAMVRGHNVRKQVKTTLKCMQALMRVQAKIHDQCSRLSVSHDAKRRSMFAESNNLWEKYKDIRQRRSMSTDENSTTDQWEKQKQPYYSTIEDLEAILQSRKESALNREKTLAYALSQHQQVCHNLNSDQAVRYEKEEEENTEYWQSGYGIASQRSRETIKDIVEVESLKVQPHSPLIDRAAENQHSLSYHYQSPTRTPSFSTCNTRPLQVRSASPRCLKKGYQSHSTTSTPSLRGYCHGNHQQRQKTVSPSSPATSILPNYMAATESAKARARTQRQTTTPKQRSYTESDRELRGSVRKRLSFPISIPEPNSDGSIYTDYSCFSQDLKSPSFRSVVGGMYGLERGALQFCYSGEISPASTGHLRKWLS